MLTESNLQELLSYQTEHSIISIFLNTEPEKGNVDDHKLKLRSLLKEINLAEDKSVIERYFDHEFDWSGRSVAVFSCAPEEFFRAYTLAVPIRSRVRVSNRPHVKPLADLLDSYGGYGVVLVDKQGARLFSFHLGTLMEQEGVIGESIRRTKHGGGSQAAGRRSGDTGQTKYSAELADRNMKEIVEFAASFFAENNVRRVLIGGSDDNISLFRNHLPKSWRSLIVGTFPISMSAGHAEVLDRATQVGQEAEKQRESRIVEAVITGAAKGQGGVLRIEDTLGAVHEGRVQTLIIKEGFSAPGYRCRGCTYLTAQKLDICPFCNNKFERIPDAVDMAVRKVLQAGGDVEVLHDSRVIEEHGNIGAILRY